MIREEKFNMVFLSLKTESFILQALCTFGNRRKEVNDFYLMHKNFIWPPNIHLFNTHVLSSYYIITLDDRLRVQR